MKSASILTPVIAALTIAASPDVQAVTIRTDLDADTKARLELVERLRASRGLRYFNRTAPMPDAVVIQAPTVTLTANAFPQAPAPAPRGCRQLHSGVDRGASRPAACAAVGAAVHELPAEHGRGLSRNRARPQPDVAR